MNFISTRLASWPKTACLTPEHILSPAQNADPRLRQHLMNYWHDLFFRVRVLHAMESRCKGGFYGHICFETTWNLLQCDKTCSSNLRSMRPPVNIHQLTLSFFHSFICSFIHPSDSLDISAVIIRKRSKKAKPHEVRILWFHRLWDASLLEIIKYNFLI